MTIPTEGLSNTEELENHIRVLESAVAELNREIEFLKASDIVSSIQINVFQLMMTSFTHWVAKEMGKNYHIDVVPELMPVARKGVEKLKEACHIGNYPDWLTKAVTDGVNRGLGQAEKESRDMRKISLGPDYVG